MIVISDTSPLNYLIEIGCVDVLPVLYGEIVIPGAVARELGHAGASETVRGVISARPAWLAVRQVNRIDPSIKLGAGEVEAISLAIELKADRLLVDDRAASRVARDRGVNATGTLTVLAEASARGLIDLKETLKKLRQTNFRVSEVVIQELLRIAGGGNSSKPPHDPAD